MCIYVDEKENLFLEQSYLFLAQFPLKQAIPLYVEEL